jgi:hypothetical protein
MIANFERENNHVMQWILEIPFWKIFWSYRQKKIASRSSST